MTRLIKIISNIVAMRKIIRYILNEYSMYIVTCRLHEVAVSVRFSNIKSKDRTCGKWRYRVNLKATGQMNIKIGLAKTWK